MAPKSRIWTKDIEYKLIFGVQNRPALWDVSCKNYKRTDLKEAQWAEVAASLGPDFTVDMTKKRFLNMKDTFMENHRKVRESKRRSSGKGPEEIYTPKWGFYTALLFLLKSIAQSDSLSNLDDDDKAESLCEPPLSIYYDTSLKSFISIPPTASSCKHPCTDSSDCSLLSPTVSPPPIMSPSPQPTLPFPDRPASAPSSTSDLRCDSPVHPS